MPDAPTDSVQDGAHPGLTACSLCAGETLGQDDPLPGGQMARLRAVAARGAARLTLVECLDECERGDVVVARPSSTCRKAGALPVWFERLAGDRSTDALESWLRQGGPGARAVPADLAQHLIQRGTEESAGAAEALHPSQ